MMTTIRSSQRYDSVTDYIQFDNIVDLLQLLVRNNCTVYYRLADYGSVCWLVFVFFFSSRRRHTRCSRDWSSDVCSSDLVVQVDGVRGPRELRGAQRAELVAQGAQPSRVVRDVGHARTSSASRRPSPTRLTPSTVMPIASPGKSNTHGATRSRSRPSAIMAPQDGVGGWAPRPTNERAASAMIAPPTPRVAAMITGPRTLGSTCRATSRASDAPSARAACT